MVLRDETFAGRIGVTVAESEPDFERLAHPGDGAPNVVVVVLDDLGFAHLGCYGSAIDTALLGTPVSGVSITTAATSFIKNICQ